MSLPTGHNHTLPNRDTRDYFLKDVLQNSDPVKAAGRWILSRGQIAARHAITNGCSEDCDGIREVIAEYVAQKITEARTAHGSRATSAIEGWLMNLGPLQDWKANVVSKVLDYGVQTKEKKLMAEIEKRAAEIEAEYKPRGPVFTLKLYAKVAHLKTHKARAKALGCSDRTEYTLHAKWVAQQASEAVVTPVVQDAVQVMEESTPEEKSALDDLMSDAWLTEVDEDDLNAAFDVAPVVVPKLEQASDDGARPIIYSEGELGMTASDIELLFAGIAY